MVGTGVLMLLASWSGWWIYRRQRWMASVLPRPLLWALTVMTFSGWLAMLAGWYVTEIGRQPFIVFGLLRTAEVASNVAPPMMAFTLARYLVVSTPLILHYLGLGQ